MRREREREKEGEAGRQRGEKGEREEIRKGQINGTHVGCDLSNGNRTLYFLLDKHYPYQSQSQQHLLNTHFTNYQCLQN